MSKSTTAATTPTTATAYLRMSTDKQQDSPARQRKEIEALAERLNYTIIEWYQDHGMTGTESKKRPEFQRMLKDAKAGKFKALLLSEQSRMSREPIFDQIDHWKILRDAGVAIVTPAGEMNFNDLGGLLTSIVGAHGAHDESRKIAERVTSGKRLAISKGRRQGGPLFGYDREVKDERGVVLRRVHFRERFIKSTDCTVAIVPSTDKAAVAAVRYAYEAIAAGKLLADVKRWFDQQGILSAMGNAFDNADIRRLLINPVYCGTLRHGFHGANGSKFYRVLPEGPIEVKDAHPALVSPELFERVQTILSARHKKRTRGPAGQYLLHGIIRCAHCGRKMYGGKVRWGERNKQAVQSKEMMRYTCASYGRGSDPTCPHPSIKAEYVEKAVLEMIRNRVLSPANRARIAERMAAGGTPVKYTTPEQDRYAEIQADIARAEKNLARAVSDADYAAIARSLAGWREEAEILRPRGRCDAPTPLPTGEAGAAIARLQWMCENFHKAPRQRLADDLKQTIARIEIRREDCGEYSGATLSVWTGVIHFAPDLHPEPVILTGEDLAGRATRLRDVLAYLRTVDGDCKTYKIVKATGYDRGTVRRNLIKAQRLELVERIGYRGGWRVISP